MDPKNCSKNGQKSHSLLIFDQKKGSRFWLAAYKWIGCNFFLDTFSRSNKTNYDQRHIRKEYSGVFSDF